MASANLKIFITYQYFTPAYKAGGPIQSLNNLVKRFNDKGVSLYVYCSNKDIDGRVLNEVAHDEWLMYTPNTKVYYSTGTKESVYEVLTATQPDVIFINGLFSYPFTLKPLLWSGESRKILSARGMLHPGALSQKPFKKKLFIQLFKLLGLQHKCEFHATTTEEEGFIKTVFGRDVKVWVAPNFTKAIKREDAIEKATGTLFMLTVALVSPMKNIKLVLEALQNCKSPIVYHIYGPIKDEQYWNECKQLLNTMPSHIKVEYKGAIEPDKVQDVLQQYHCFIMPSKSENFGHAIFEALSIGKPVITSRFTPWNDLEKHSAGYNVDVDNTSTITNAIEKMAAMNNEEYKQWSVKAAAYADMQIDTNAVMTSYKSMFKRP